MAGLTSEGFVKKTYTEILSDLQTSERTNIDPNIDTRDDELLGQLNKILSLILSSEWDLAQATNDNFIATRAEGFNLDDLATIIGITRIAESRSSTQFQQFTGNEGSVISVGTLLRNPFSTDRFEVTSELTLTVEDCLKAVLIVPVVSDSTTYTLTVNTIPYNYTSDASATESEILNGLQSAIDSDGSATYTATVEGSTLVVETDNSTNISVDGLVGLTASKATNITTARAQEYGVIVAGSGTVTEIIAGSSVDSTTNTSAYVVGRETETDEAFRLRLLNSQQITGGATVPSIEDTLRNISGVTSAVVYENRSLVVDAEGRAGKSFEAIVEGGIDQEVAQTIYNSKPAGIETHGTTTSLSVLNSLGDTAKDSDGSILLINFTRPAAVNLAFNIEYTKYDEESFPSNGETLIKSVVTEYIESLAVGVDIIPQRLFGTIYRNVQGIDSLVVEIQEIASAGDTPVVLDWQTTKLDINYKQFGATTETDVYVSEV